MGAGPRQTTLLWLKGETSQRASQKKSTFQAQEPTHTLRAKLVGLARRFDEQLGATIKVSYPLPEVRLYRAKTETLNCDPPPRGRAAISHQSERLNILLPRWPIPTQATLKHTIYDLNFLGHDHRAVSRLGTQPRGVDQQPWLPPLGPLLFHDSHGSPFLVSLPFSLTYDMKFQRLRMSRMQDSQLTATS